uniref:YgiT-type zinc finger protein n=1 Tax=Leptospirillum ferriphilum TaxID=178606 RepID=A0A7C3LTC8_9BACT
MKCQVCGGNMEPQMTDRPFKLSPSTIAILRDLPILLCANRGIGD